MPLPEFPHYIGAPRVVTEPFERRFGHPEDGGEVTYGVDITEQGMHIGPADVVAAINAVNNEIEANDQPCVTASDTDLEADLYRAFH